MKVQRLGAADFLVTFDNYDEAVYYGGPGQKLGPCIIGTAKHFDDFEREIGREDAIKILAPLGAWSREELADTDDAELYARILWVSAGAAVEEGRGRAGEIETYLSAY